MNPEKKPTDSDYLTVGTAPFDIFPTYEEWSAPFREGAEPNMGGLAAAHFGHLPVWVDGNAYFNGATVYHKEGHFLEDPKGGVKVELAEKNGKTVLKTNLYSRMKNFRDGIITSDILGKAFEPEQRFERPDGTPILFNRDYFGNPRGVDTIPGPFATADSMKTVW